MTPGTTTSTAGIPTRSFGRNGLIPVRSDAELNAEARLKVEQARPPEAILSGLAAFIESQWSLAKRAKMNIEQEMIASLRLVKGEYEPDKLQAIRSFGGSEVFIRLCSNKVRDAEAWMLDILDPGSEETWALAPTPMADLPQDIKTAIKKKIGEELMAEASQSLAETGIIPSPAIMDSVMREQTALVEERVKEQAQEIAVKRAEAMELKIRDQLAEGKWEKALRAFIKDVASKKTAILKGPIFRKRKCLKWVVDPATGTHKMQASKEIIPEFYRVNPFDFYPVTNDVDPDIIELHHMKRSHLTALIGVPGYKEDAIRAVLQEYSDGYREITVVDQDRKDVEENDPSSTYAKKLINSLEYNGYAPGKDLLEYGLTPEQIPDPDIDYLVNAWKIGRHVIKATLNPDPKDRKPYAYTSYSTSNDSCWGEGPPDLMPDIASMVNAAARALSNNMAIASGPIGEYDIDRLAPGETGGSIWPWRMIGTTSKNMQEGPAVRFSYPGMHAEPLMAVYEKFKQQADDLVVPSYAHGNPQVGGAGNTASGLSMLMTAAARNIKLAIGNIVAVMVEMVERLYDFNMMYDPDESIKGDSKVLTKGGAALISAKEQMAVRRTEFLAATNNDMDNQIIGIRGRAAMLKVAVKDFDMDPKKVIPNIEAIEKGRIPPLPVPVQPDAGSPESPRTLDLAGNPVSGKDTTLVNREKP